MFLKSSLQIPIHMRTIQQRHQEDRMLKEINATLARASDTLIGDLLGVVSLFSLLIVGLYLPELAALF